MQYYPPNTSPDTCDCAHGPPALDCIDAFAVDDPTRFPHHIYAKPETIAWLREVLDKSNAIRTGISRFNLIDIPIKNGYKNWPFTHLTPLPLTTVVFRHKTARPPKLNCSIFAVLVLLAYALFLLSSVAFKVFNSLNSLHHRAEQAAITRFFTTRKNPCRKPEKKD